MKERWQDLLQAELKGAKKLVILGTGNALKGDDAIGLLVASLLDSHLNRYQKKKVKILRAYEMIELYLKKIKRIKPTHIIIVDAINMKTRPGTIRVRRINSINVNNQPGKQLVDGVGDFLEKLASVSSAKIYLVSIQPENLEFGHPITQKTRLSARKIADSINQIFPRKPCPG
ncbi:MAG TPA: hydrogenase maturation protease [Candidatus Saccharicenans sp.]|jgi:hydrogenase 3 maturation protease|nr:hydrogenase maturation protease [Candidatus Saccharicenans sp.]HRD01491.1 hydrogenase maturation protease [Candidatus Saccharicenans sp.]